MITADDLPAWTPEPDDVGNIIARLIPDASGHLTGHFSATTIPTEAQVVAILDGVAAEVALVVRNLPDEVFPAARRVAALGTAVDVAEAYFPEIPQAYVDRLRSRYDTALARLVAGADRETDDDSGGAFEVFSFGPPARPELTSWT